MLDTYDEVGISDAVIDELAAGHAAASMRTVPDFLVGAHALMQCAGLMTRDAGFYRDYFKGLKLIVPKAA